MSSIDEKKCEDEDTTSSVCATVQLTEGSKRLGELAWRIMGNMESNRTRNITMY